MRIAVSAPRRNASRTSAAETPARFAERYGSGKHRDRGMPDIAEMRVVIIERVRDCPIGERCGACGNLAGEAEHAGVAATALGDEIFADDFGGWLALARMRHRQPIEQREPRHASGSFWN